MRWIYAARLRFALRRKALMLSFPLIVFFLGLGAWIGLPTVLRPVEKVVNMLGADLNEVPGYVARQASLHGAQVGRLDCAGRRLLVLHAQPLSGGELQSVDGSAADPGCADQANPGGRQRAGQDRPRELGARSGAHWHDRNLCHAQAARSVAARHDRTQDLGRDQRRRHACPA